jgi:Type III flagellar switch regulator (C-ring) FliN C-term
MSDTAMPYLLLGEERTALLRARLLHAMQAWQQHWFARVAPLDLTIEPAVASPGMSSLSVVFAASQPVLHIGASEEFVARSLGLQAMSAPGGSSGMQAVLARSLQLEMLQHLGQIVLQPSGVQASFLPTEAEDFELCIDTLRWWYAGFSQPHSFERLAMLIHPMIVAGLLPLQQSVLAALNSRRAAIGSEVVEVEAWLGEVRLSLRDFTTLRVGDVLVLEDDQSGYLTGHDRGRIATLQPGRQQQQRAVRIGTALHSSSSPSAQL